MKRVKVGFWFIVFAYCLISGCVSSRYVYEEGNKYNVAYLVDISLDNKASLDPIPGLDKSNLIASLSASAFIADYPSDETEKAFSTGKDEKDRVLKWYSQTFQDGSEGLKNIPPKPKHRWDIAYEEMVKSYQRNKAINAGFQIVAIEPSFGFYDKAYMNKAEEYERAEIIKDRSPIWPAGDDLTWHLGAEYSQLDLAYQELKNKGVPNNHKVKVAHLDTGYFGEDALRPEGLLFDESRDFIENGSGNGQNNAGKASHGTRTLSTLAGGVVHLSADDGGGSRYIGAYPDMKVAEYRINEDSPINFNTKRMAKAIIAAAENGFDVISISAGGFPSILLKNAINEAYDKGTAVIAASGDFFKPLPFFKYSTPKTIVFPARYNRVLGVAGITAANKSYGDDPCFLCFLKFWGIRQWPSWMLRGSYGPESEMKGHTIAAYAPNITHSVGNTENKCMIAKSGSGTSHATPQVAAAAAMWLEYNYDLLKDDWRTWKKTEAVYQALMQSADRCLPLYTVETMGEGVLKASTALKENIGLDKLVKRPESTTGLKWIKDMIDTTSFFDKYDVQLMMCLQEMAFTELQQVIHRSQKVRKLLQALRLVKKREGCENVYDLKLDNRRLKILHQIIRVILKKDISDTLRSALKEIK